MIADLALSMGVLPSALLAEDADLVEALIDSARRRAKAMEPAPSVADPSDLARRMTGGG